MFYNRKQDKKLGIRTTGINRLSPRQYPDSYQTESTDYLVLEELFDQYSPTSNGRFVDFGCGKGRVLFFVHQHLHIQTVGIELNPDSFFELNQNRESYMQKFNVAEEEITIHQGYAQEHVIKENDAIFYFFNPFSLKVVKEVISNIIQSLKEYPRAIEIIFYYPNSRLTDFIDHLPQFELTDQYKIKSTYDNNDIVLVFKNIY